MVEKNVLLCGEIHYFRVPKQLWGDRLLKLKRAGANCVSTYIPWNWHSPREDTVDFNDETQQWHVASYYSRDLVFFLRLARELGLRVIARPGPYICSEWDSGGHPNWIYTKTRKLRSLDPGYMKYVKDWYSKVLEVLRPYVEDGTVVAIQVENEYFWGNEEYIEHLAEIVREKLPGVLVFTNEDPYLARIPNTIDPYPTPWDVKQVDVKIKNYLSSQPGFFKMAMEVQGGWFKASRYGYYPTNRLSIPAEWTEFLLKTIVGMGIDNVSIYMFHGGSNPGYYTGKYIDSSYDFEASIREWGELSERYYRVKRVYTLLGELRDIVPNLESHGENIKTASTCSDILVRSSKQGKLVILRNLSDSLCYQRLIIEDRVVPHWTPIRIPPRYAKAILLDMTLGNTPFRLVYTSGEVLLARRLGDAVLLVIYGDHGEISETAIEVKDGIQSIDTRGAILVHRNGEQVYLVTTHVHGEQLVAIKTLTGHVILVVFTCKCRAERTWILDRDLILVSNIYYVGDYEKREDKLILRAELDENSCGELLVITPRELKSIKLGEKNLELNKTYENIYTTHIPLDACSSGEEKIYQPVKYEVLEDPLFYELTKIPESTPLEKAGFYENGIYVYKLRFHLTKDILEKIPNKHVAITGFSDFAVVSINGKYAGSGYHHIEVSGEALREGENEVVVILESTGHPNDGFLYVPNGIYGGVYLGRVGEIRVSRWRKIDYKIPYGPSFDFSEFIENPDSVVKLLQSPETSSSPIEVHSIDSPGLYIAEFTVNDVSKHYVLDPGVDFYYNHYYRILLFINKEYVGPVIGPIDITQYVKPGVNEVALLVEWGVIYPIIHIYHHRVTGEWFVQEGVYGLIEKWYKRRELGGTSIHLPMTLSSRAGRVVWINTVIPYEEEPSSTRPMKLEVDFQGCRVLVFVNGEFVGRLYDDSPRRELYVPETALRRGVNNITLLVIVASRNSSLKGIHLRRIYEHVEKELVLN